MRRYRLLVVNERFWPDTASTGRQLGELVASIHDLRPDVDIQVFASNRPYRSPGRQKRPKRQEMGGVRLRRIASFPGASESTTRRLLCDLWFSLKTAALVALTQFDGVLASTNPPTLAPFVATVSKMRRKRFVYLIHDLYPDIAMAVESWRPDGIVSRLTRLVQRKTLHAADQVIVLGRCMKDLIRDSYGVEANRISVVTNWPTVEVGGTHPRQASEELLVMYSGNLGQSQDFDTLLGAAELLRDEPRIRFAFFGQGWQREHIASEIETNCLTNVLLGDFVPEEKFQEVLGSAGLGVVSLAPSVEGLNVPGKMYNLLARGVPLLAIVGDSSEVARVIDEHRVGYRVDCGDARAAAAAILDAHADPAGLEAMRERARNYIREHANLPALSRRFASILFGAAVSKP
jgi:glycosyltransferase involved in cell wall biosynthesis